MSNDGKHAHASEIKADALGRVKQIQSLLMEWGESHYDDFPWRAADNHFHALIAELMLQRTKAEQVLPVYNDFVELCPSLEAAKDVSESQIRAILHPLGLNWRIDNIVELVNVLTKKGHVPLEYDSLVKLEGVGPYVASAFLSFHASIRLSIIDSNVVRLWGRIFSLKTNTETRRKKWFKQLADEMMPHENFKAFNYSLLDFTRAICKPKPDCTTCPIKKYCNYYVTL